MEFRPETRIEFLHTGIDEFNKITAHNQTELMNYLSRGDNLKGRIVTDSSFQKGDGSFTVRVDHSDIPYYTLLQCDTVAYKNYSSSDVSFWIIGNIIAVEWKNPDCSFVRFKIDHFMTYQDKINWDKTYGYVEREHIRDDWSAEGGNPLFSNMGPTEDFGVQADTPFFTHYKEFDTTNVLIQSPYDETGKPTFDGKLNNNLYSSLNSLVMTPSEANAYFKLIAENKETSINNIVGVYGISEYLAGEIRDGGTAIGGATQLPSVNEAMKTFPNRVDFRNAKCYSSPFMTVKLFSSDGESVEFTPQWFGNDISVYNFRYRWGTAGGMFGAYQATFENKNGTFDWAVWNDFIVSLKALPSCPWTGDGFTNWQKVNEQAVISNAVTGVFNGASRITGGVGQLMSGEASGTVGGVGNVVAGIAETINPIFNLAASIGQEKATGAAVNGVGSYSPLIDVCWGTWGFKIVYYMAQFYAMQSIDQYFDRFGYRINRLKKIEIENRPKWTFVKTHECHVATTTGIPYVSQMAINSMFNHGVTFWRGAEYQSGLNIGDYSEPQANKGIKGWTP